jgi:8-oxo-dGTP pyrophosphatase MutT (NUDIX family)
MSYTRTTPRRMSAGVILVDRQGRVLMQLRDDDPAIMFPGHWGLTGGAAHAGETPEEAARREVEEETGVRLGRLEPFRAYYFNNRGAAKKSATAASDYELYLFHAPCETPADEMICGEGRGLRFFGPDEVIALDLAYNHRDVLTEFFSSAAYARYLDGDAFNEPAPVDAAAHFVAETQTGAPWFDALMDAIALWEHAAEDVEGRSFRYLVGGEAFDWLLLAERLITATQALVPADEAERLLFEALPPGSDGPMEDERLRQLIGETKYRAHLNYVYGVIVEEALQYAAELDVAKEGRSITMFDSRSDDEECADPVFQRVYGATREKLASTFREETRRPRLPTMSLAEFREFLYWLFQYRVKNHEPARVASDTRKALAQLSAIEAAARRRRARDVSAAV